MPEGDTIFRAAATLQKALRGAVVEDFRTVLPKLGRVDHDTPIKGRTIEDVSSVGKHLLIRFSGDLVLRSHMRMNGSWHIYRRGERWRRRASAMRVVIATRQYEAVGFDIPIAEFIVGGALESHEPLARLGPDLLAPDVDQEEVKRRYRAKPDAEMGVALLDQTIAAGVGNVFKSEVLFVCRTNPFKLVAEVDDSTLEKIITTSIRQLRQNVTTPDSASLVAYEGSRRTTGRSDPNARLYVYGRKGKPCRRCGTAVEWMKQGVDARSTYWCPRCQP